MERSAWWAAVHGGHQTVGHDLVTDFPSTAKYSSGIGLSGGDGELGWL